MKRVVIAGGSGFVGSHLSRVLSASYNVRIISRRSRTSTKDNVEYVQADLFDLEQVKTSLHQCDFAIYLVHSMSATNRLTQASFNDLDLLLADNFARAARESQLQHIIYIGGLVPLSGNLSKHILSRVTVEQTLATANIPLTAIRTGLIIGPGGSSLKILTTLVSRLPIIVLPGWAMNLTHPVALADVIDTITEVLPQPRHKHVVLHIGCPKPMTYREMLQRTAVVMKKKRIFLTVPFSSYTLSKAWVAMFSGAQWSLVSPLVESMKHDMVAYNNPIESKALSFESSLKNALKETQESRPVAKAKKKKMVNTVRSLQRMKLPQNKNAQWASQRYAIWLNRAMKVLNVHFNVSEKRIAFKFANLVLLELTEQQSSESRVLFSISGGVLAANKKHSGWLEFRQVNNNEELVVCIHDFSPGLPWPVYIFSQAQVHLLVMYLFEKYLINYQKRQEGISFSVIGPQIS